MKNTLYILFASLTLASCGNTGTTDTTTTDSTATTVTIDTPTTVQQKGTSIVAVFNNCVLYTGKTDYYFTKENGEKIEFAVPNVDGFTKEEIAEMRADGMTEMDIKFTESMLDPSEDLEGIPGANPALVGKKFLLVYDEKGALLEVKLNN